MKSKAYHEGFLAWDHGTPNSENPHPSGKTSGGGMNDKRVQWFNGWFDAKFHAKYPPWPGVE